MISNFFKPRLIVRAQVQAGETTEWELKANAHADAFAKRGAASHGVSAEQYQLWRGFQCLVEETARWISHAHVYQEDHRDHEDLMEAYFRQAAAAELVDEPAPADEPEAEPPDEGGGCLDVGYGVGVGWEEYARLSMEWRRHRLLQSEVLGRCPKVNFILFCCKWCGAVASDARLTPGLEGQCKGEQAGTGCTDQLRRIKLGCFPSYRQGVRDLKIDTPHGVLPAARGALQEQASARPAPSPEAPAGKPERSHAAWGIGDLGGRSEVMRAYGLWESDIEAVRTMGRQALARAAANPEASEGESDGVFW